MPRRILKIVSILSLISLFSSHEVKAAEPPKENQKWVLSPDGFGPVKIGMSRSAAEKALSMSLKSDREGDPNEESCHYERNEQNLPGVAFMVVEGKIVRIDILSGAYQTTTSAHIGSTEDEIRKFYPDAKVSKNSYDESGNDITVVKQGDSDGLVFETDGKAVTEFRSGSADAITWIEGCE